MDKYFMHPRIWIGIPFHAHSVLTTQFLFYVWNYSSSPKCVPVPVFLFSVQGFLCVEAGSLAVVFDFPIVSFVGLFSLSGYQKCCLRLPHTLHSQRYFLAQVLTDSFPIIHFFLTPSFTMLPHWIFLNVIHRSDHVTSLLINLKPPRSPYWLQNKFQLLSLYIQGYSTIWPQPVSNLPPPRKHCVLKLRHISSLPSIPLCVHVWGCRAFGGAQLNKTSPFLWRLPGIFPKSFLSFSCYSWRTLISPFILVTLPHVSSLLYVKLL